MRGLAPAAITTLAYLLTATAAQAQPVSRFDLVCSGEERAMGSGEKTADSRRYTIDLAAKRWCRTTECKEGLSIEKVTPDEP
jgi:hypothetical protein